MTAMPPRPDTRCPLCGSDRSEDVVVGYDRMRATEHDYTYARCGACGLLHMTPLPDPADIPGFYPDDYAPHGGAARSRTDKWINRQAVRYYYGTDSVGRSALMRGLFGLLSGHVLRDLRPPHGQNRILDVGCAAGDLLMNYRDLGWSVKGIEMSANAVEVAHGRGLDVHHGTVFDEPFEKGAFDRVILSHVIEHVLEPAEFLRRCGEYLAPGGILELATPNAKALGLRLHGSCWFPLDAPRHLMLFDPRTIEMLGVQAGLRLRRVSTPAEARMHCESRHYRLTQGQELPPDLAQRRAIVQDSIGRKQEHRGYRKLMSPLAKVGALFGRGEIMEAEFVLQGT